MKFGRGLKSDVMKEPFFSNFTDKMKTTGITKLTLLQVSSMHESSDVVSYNSGTGYPLSQTTLTEPQSRAIARLLNDNLPSSHSGIFLLNKSLEKILDILQNNNIFHASKEKIFLTRHYGPWLNVSYCLFTVDPEIEENAENHKPIWFMLINNLQQQFPYHKAQEYIASKKISKREKQVLSLLTLGKTSSEIASYLNISPYTVGSYISILGLKLEEKTRIGIALKSLQLGIIDIEIAYPEK